MYAYEMELPKISRSKIDGLKKLYGMDSEDATKYFEIHEEADVRHAQVWREIYRGSQQRDMKLPLMQLSNHYKHRTCCYWSMKSMLVVCTANWQLIFLNLKTFIHN